MSVITFHGMRIDRDHNIITVAFTDGEERLLPHIVEHSPTGMEWGYAGSGPMDLALSLCVAVLGQKPSNAIILAVCDELVSPIQEDTWELPASRVLDVITRIHAPIAERATPPPDAIP